MRATRIHARALDRGRRLRKQLADVPGLVLEHGHRGVYTHGDVAVHVSVERTDHVALRVPLPEAPAPPSPTDALVATSGLVGNLRFARAADAGCPGCHRWALVADTQLDGVAHLSGTLAEVAVDAGRVLDGGLAAAAEPVGVDAIDDAPIDKVDEIDEVAEVIRGLGWPDDAVVRHEAGWELRPRLQRPREAAVVPVRVARERGGVRVHRTLLARRPGDPGRAGNGDDPRPAALAELALRLNACARLARLAFDGPALVVETRLRGELVTSAWLREAARAVAVASAFCRPPVAVMAREHDVAEVFLAASIAPSAIPTPR